MISDARLQVLLAAVIVLLGLYAAYKGDLKVGPEDASDEDFKTLSTGSARVFGVVIALAGVVFGFNQMAGIVLLVATILLAWLIG